MKKRNFIEGEVHHTYQRSQSGLNIFYEVQDYLVYFTIFIIQAERYGITVYGLCLMIDHIHSLIASKTHKQFSSFIKTVTGLFVKEFNQAHGRSGPIFSERIGSAPKVGLKRLRTAIAYLFNNPVERYLCKLAQEYRWNFLAYGNCRHPYSEKLRMSCASAALRRAIHETEGCFKRRQHLTYVQLERMFMKLDSKEKNQLTDYIVTRYSSLIRYDLLKACYGNYENMLTAINSNTGSEYEIRETKQGASDTEYRDIYRYVRSHGFYNAGDVIRLDEASKHTLMEGILKNTSAKAYQVKKFLHIQSCTINP